MKLNKLHIITIAFAIFLASCGSYKFGSKKFECRNDLTKTATNQVQTSPEPVVIPAVKTEKVEHATASKSTIQKDEISKTTSNLIVAKSKVAQIRAINKMAKGISPELKSAVVQKLANTKNNDAPNQSTQNDDPPIALLYVLCIFLPPVAVGLATNWDMNKVIYNCLWCLLCWLPGMIHAFMIVSKEKG